MQAVRRQPWRLGVQHSAAGMLQFRADDLDVSVQVHDRRSALSLHCSNNGRRYVRGRQ